MALVVGHHLESICSPKLASAWARAGKLRHTSTPALMPLPKVAEEEAQREAATGGQ